jgi:GTP cyclohydrolase III
MPVKVGILRLIDYEQWIATLGYDREHLIQVKQLSFLKEVFKLSARIYAFALPLTYDLTAVVLNSVGTTDYMKLARLLAFYAPAPLKPLIGMGETYWEALSKANEVTSEVEINAETIAVQVDVNGYYSLLSQKGPYDAYKLMMELKGTIQEIANSLGGLTFYAGGDNIIVFLPAKKQLNAFLSNILKIARVKVGVGLAPTPRDAVALSTKALSTVREQKIDSKNLILQHE